MASGQAPTEEVKLVEGERGTSLPARKKSDRLYFADNLRTYLITLVVTAPPGNRLLGRGPSITWSQPTTTTGVPVLVIFIAINQAYFMGLLFLISGYFSPGSLERKGARRFVKDRLIRLGIPLVVFFFVLNPIASIGTYAMPASLSGITTPLSWQDYPQLVGFGPIWFVAMLLIFDISFAIWWAARRNRMPRQESSNEPPRYRAIAAFILILALTSYLIRIVIPIGEFVAGFPTLSYFPQYLSFFIIGTVAVPPQLAPERSEVDGEGGLRLGAGRDDHSLSPCDQRRRHKCRRLRVLAVCGLCAVGFDRCRGNVPRADHTLPRPVQLVGQLQPIPAATLVHSLCHPGPNHRIRCRCADGTLARAPAQVRSGSGDHGSTLFCGSLSGSEDSVRVQGPLNLRGFGIRLPESFLHGVRR